ncbi:hypothetical protein FIU95_05605 [Microbulbifer sp. THAF38]|nr:hypothetical protein FIU95_05605 [Microbulbifer sp. THAF38]
MVIAVCYLSGYYWTFGVDIFSYISAPDLIMAAAIPLVTLGLASGVGLFLGVILSDKKDEHSASTVKGKVYRSASVLFDIFAGLLIVGTLAYGGDDKWRVIPVVLTLLILSLARQAGLLNPLIRNYSHLNYLVIFVAIYFPIQAYAHGKLKALNIISGKDYKSVTIPKLLSGFDLRYIGKAGDNLFAWEGKKGEVHILNTDKFDHVVVSQNAPKSGSR